MAALMITDMRLFSGMCPGMNSQRTALDEALIAVLDGAMIRSFIGMYSIMSTEIRFAIERLSTVLPGTVKIATRTWSHGCEEDGAGWLERVDRSVVEAGSEINGSGGV